MIRTVTRKSRDQVSAHQATFLARAPGESLSVLGKACFRVPDAWARDQAAWCIGQRCAARPGCAAGLPTRPQLAGSGVRPRAAAGHATLRHAGSAACAKKLVLAVEKHIKDQV